MSPKLTIAYESADASPAPAANPGDRIDAMFEAAEERHRAARRMVSMLLRALVYLGALLTTAVLLFLVGYILVNGVPYLTPSLFEWEYNSTNVSLMPALVNTLLMAALSLLMAVPVGVGSAIYLVEYAKRGSRFVQMVRTTTETLQGIPSIIYGLFGLLFFVPVFGAAIGAGIGALTGAIVKHGVDKDFQDRVRNLLSGDDSAAVFMVVDEMTTDKFIDAIRPFGGDVLQTSLSIKDEEELKHELFKN